MKKMMMTLMAMLTIAVSATAMSFEQARNEALFLTDKMAYELNLTDEQYEACYEINLDYLMGVTGRNDVFGVYWERRNLDLSYILFDWQWNAYLAASYFYRPLYWEAGYWHFGIYARYPHRDYFYFGRPHFYATYRGGHAWHVHGGRGYYYDRREHFRAPRREHVGMHDRWDRGEFNGRSHSSTRVTARPEGRGRIENRGRVEDRGRNDRGIGRPESGARRTESGTRRPESGARRPEAGVGGAPNRNVERGNENNGVRNRQVEGNHSYGSGNSGSRPSSVGSNSSTPSRSIGNSSNSRPSSSVGSSSSSRPSRSFGSSSSAPSRSIGSSSSSRPSSSVGSHSSAPSRSIGSSAPSHSSSPSRSMGSSSPSRSMGGSHSGGSSSRSSGGHAGGRR
ncbi:MAG: hypothetical protein J6T44_00505 [Prevotella sp.]|nr:hypothetical protein [Prevotella sp.]